MFPPDGPASIGVAAAGGIAAAAAGCWEAALHFAQFLVHISALHLPELAL